MTWMLLKLPRFRFRDFIVTGVHSWLYVSCPLSPPSLSESLLGDPGPPHEVILFCMHSTQQPLLHEKQYTWLQQFVPVQYLLFQLVSRRIRPEYVVWGEIHASRETFTAGSAAYCDANYTCCDTPKHPLMICAIQAGDILFSSLMQYAIIRVMPRKFDTMFLDEGQASTSNLNSVGLLVNLSASRRFRCKYDA